MCKEIINADISHMHADGQNKADRGATRARSEAYLTYAATTSRGSNEDIRNYVRLHKRRISRVINVGNVKIGGNNPITIQTMTKVKTRDSKHLLAQIKRIEKSGADLVRVSIPDEKSIHSLISIKDQVKMPLIADVHFNYKHAINALNAGIHCVRINPGNIGGLDKFLKVVESAAKNNGALRIGVNSGSIDKNIVNECQDKISQMVKSAMIYIEMVEKIGFYNYKISLKSTDVTETILSYRELAKHTDAPFHIGITEAGTLFIGSIRSAIGIGILLWEGFGDTIRVSLSSEPELEVKAGFEILKSLGLRERGIHLISCPTCGRCDIDIIGIANKIEQKIGKIDKPIKVAVMGCVVNGPGEAKDADIGIAGGRNFAYLFKKGVKIKRVESDRIVDALIDEIKKF